MSSKINFLNSNNFVVMGAKQKSLGINIQGNVLVFFKMKTCPNCSEFEPVFASLPRTENRVVFAILDVTDNRDVVLSSRETTTPITAVPILILYVNGRPHAKFGGTKNIPSIQAFITKALQTNAVASEPRQQFMSGSGVRRQVEDSLGPSGPPSGGRGKAWIPEIGTAPSMKGIIKGAGRGGYAHGSNVEEEDEPRLLIPDSVIPHNTPWEAEFISHDAE